MMPVDARSDPGHGEVPGRDRLQRPPKPATRQLRSRPGREGGVLAPRVRAPGTPVTTDRDRKRGGAPAGRFAGGLPDHGAAHEALAAAAATPPAGFEDPGTRARHGRVTWRCAASWAWTGAASTTWAARRHRRGRRTLAVLRPRPRVLHLHVLRAVPAPHGLGQVRLLHPETLVQGAAAGGQRQPPAHAGQRPAHGRRASRGRRRPGRARQALRPARRHPDAGRAYPPPARAQRCSAATLASPPRPAR